MKYYSRLNEVDDGLAHMALDVLEAWLASSETGLDQASYLLTLCHRSPPRGP